VSHRNTLALALSIVFLLAVIGIALWNPITAFVAICAAMVAALIARIITSQQRIVGEAESIDGDNLSEMSRDLPHFSPTANIISPAALLDATMNSMREGVLIVDQELRIIGSNAAAHETFEGVDGKFETVRLSDLTRNPSIHDAFRAAVEKGDHVEAKVEMLRGNRRSFDLRVAPLRFEVAGQTSGAIGIFFDITQLERLERVRQEFLSNVSHELRTPLTAIIAFVETLEEGAIEDSANNRRFLTVIRRNAERMHSLIDDILELSAIEAGIVTVEPHAVRLRSVIEDITTALAARAEARSIKLRNQIAQGVIVYADARRLEQMLTNLIDNAVKFNREGGEVTIRHAATATRDCVSVIDTGDGVAGEHIERIFERFYRVDRARSRNEGGTGLGLAIVKHLARAHGGEATVQSTPGKGSTFTIELPNQVVKDE
jgi:two-component system phosphate regulon sensor histidine kinase PhoR